MHDSRSDPAVASPARAAEPVACALTPGDLESRRDTLLPGLVRRASRREEVPDGYRWIFPAEPGLLEEIAHVIEAERHCCRFLAFAISAPPSGGPISMEATGLAGTKEFLDGLMFP